LTPAGNRPDTAAKPVAPSLSAPAAEKKEGETARRATLAPPLSASGGASPAAARPVAPPIAPPGAPGKKGEAAHKGHLALRLAPGESSAVPAATTAAAAPPARPITQTAAGLAALSLEGGQNSGTAAGSATGTPLLAVAGLTPPELSAKLLGDAAGPDGATGEAGGATPSGGGDAALADDATPSPGPDLLNAAAFGIGRYGASSPPSPETEEDDISLKAAAARLAATRSLYRIKPAASSSSPESSDREG